MTWLLRRYLVEFILLVNAGAFSVLLAELLILEHTNGIRLVAPVSASVGMVLSLAAVALRGSARYATAAAFLILAGTGLLGVTRHLTERDGGLSVSLAATASAQSGSNDDDDDDNSGRGGSGDDGGGDDEAEPPPLAPLALSGSAALGALAALAGVPGRDSVREEPRL